MKLIIARSALHDLQSIREHYAELAVPGIGQEFVGAILQKVQRLIDHPDSGRQVPEFGQEQIREIIHPPFRIVYLRDSSAVSVIRVWRSERVLLLPEDEA
ncbi:MAG: type II toxin-antitoxin system RelE/ParE family toxin [Haliea sp.]